MKNIFSPMYFCHKVSSFGGKSRNRKLLLKIARFHAHPRGAPPVGVVDFQSTLREVF